MLLSIVVPCYNEEAVLPETCRRLCKVLEGLRGRGKIEPNSRIWFVDDGSSDRTWSVIESFISSGLPVVGIKLSRNCGHQNALMAGLFTADGSAVVSIDADLQDDERAIEQMVDLHAEGNELVFGVRKDRSVDSLFKRGTARLFYRLMNALGAESIPDHADFRLMGRRAIEALKRFDEANLYLRGVVPLLGFRSAIVHFDRRERFAGETKYPLSRMLSLALKAITSFSVVPLRLISVLGLVVSGISAAFGLWVLWAALYSGHAVAGWASTVLPIYFLGGLQLMSIGVIGEYVGKTYLETKRRPRFIVDAVVRR
jgi:glycosyltransferase involved in cell wall biosynthesis